MKWLTNYTAEKLRRELRDRSPGSREDGAPMHLLGRRPVLVRCTSATAADTSGVGAQCYPGVIVDTKGSPTTQAELGTVWLTVLGQGAATKKPQANRVYHCILAGPVTTYIDDNPANTSAANLDIRPRAFAGGDSAASPADCARRFATLPECATLEITEVLGSCACITVGQTASLTRNSSGVLVSGDDDLLYGCPPGVVTSLCPSGAPSKFSSLFAGFTGVYAVLNGGWTWTWTTGNTWVATKSGITATLVMTAGITYTITFSGGTSAVNALQYTVSGDSNCCDAVTLTKV